MSRPDAVRTAWSLITLNVRVLAQGPGSVPDEDFAAAASAMENPADWGAVVAVLAELAAEGWVNHHGTADEGLEHCAEVALMLAADGAR